ncbi:hypothetical protein [Kitasatospora sp. NPDC051914]|uniref:efflux RND transporter periplasmic adaptor subunit n=1 Tax=Kitasatospora sp. NPDC051914 TaxID=3154945 RepID=UPI00341A9FCA
MFTVKRDNIRLTTRMDGTVTRAATYWLSFGSVVAYTETKPGETGTCGRITVDNPPAVLGKITSLPVAAGTHVVAGTVLARADTARARSDLATAEQELSQATAALKARQAAVSRPAPAPAAGTSRSASSAASTPGSLLGLPEEQLAADQQRVAEAQRRKDQAQQAVAASTITAPAAGFVESVNTAVGADPSCEEPVVVLRADELQVESSIDAATLAKLRVGQQALVTVPDARARGTTALEGLPTSAVTPGSRDQPVSGKAGSDALGAHGPEGEEGRIADLGGQAARYLMELRLPVPPAGVLPGIRAEVTLTLDSRDHVLAVPPSAIHHDREGDYVLVLQCDDIGENGECRKSVPVRTTVRLGLAGDRLTEVISGLAENDSVVLPAPEE